MPIVAVRAGAVGKVVICAVAANARKDVNAAGTGRVGHGRRSPKCCSDWNFETLKARDKRGGKAACLCKPRNRGDG